VIGVKDEVVNDHKLNFYYKSSFNVLDELIFFYLIEIGNFYKMINHNSQNLKKCFSNYKSPRIITKSKR
jgi:hypothetical protein